MSVATQAESNHEDPAIAAFLGLLEADIRSGQHVQSLPQDLAKTMLAHAGRRADLDEEIEGELAL